MLGNIGTVELFLIMLAILLVFGAKRIPEIAQGLGKGIREFRSAMREISNELQAEDRQMRRSTDLRSAPGRSEPNIAHAASGNVSTANASTAQTHGTPDVTDQTQSVPAFTSPATTEDRSVRDAAVAGGYGTGR